MKSWKIVKRRPYGHGVPTRQRFVRYPPKASRRKRNETELICDDQIIFSVFSVSLVVS